MILNKECVLLQNEIRKFAQQVILEKADELNQSGKMPVDNLNQLAEMGILGANAPEEFEGAALDAIGTTIAIEEISKVCASTALIIAVQNACFIQPLLKYGTSEQKQKYIASAATGRIIGGYAMINANELTIEKQADKFILNGKNHFLLNGEANGPFIVFVPAGNLLSAFLIEPDLNPVSRSKANTMGMNSAGIASVIFDNYTLDKNNLLGEENQGKNILNDVMPLAKIYFAAIALGLMEGSFESALKYAQERVQFNEPIINFGMVREKIADIATRIEASRNMIYDAALSTDSNIKNQRLASIAKYFAGQSVVEITTQVIQIYGGYGYMKDYPVERYFRDAQVVNILGDRPDVIKEHIVKDILGK